jgi:hypothetical protein
MATKELSGDGNEPRGVTTGISEPLVPGSPSLKQAGITVTLVTVVVTGGKST